jgi:hypothetical protein
VIGDPRIETFGEELIVAVDMMGDGYMSLSKAALSC